MAKDLRRIIRLRKWEVDERQRTLAQLLAAERQIIEAIEAFEQRLAAEHQAYAADASGAGLTFGAFVARAREKRDNLNKSRAAVEQQIAAARDALAEAFKDLKALEVVQDNRDRAERKAADRREQISLDEIGLDLHRRREGA